ncbi:MAG: lactate racemase domain-containing protein [Spirochaetia bacterium]|jgi:nickel-dependent lactate racemase|nr:lactate racemase domain-containing protein [Spirochaetia bacterium]
MTLEIYNSKNLLEESEIFEFMGKISKLLEKKEKILLLPPDISRFSSGAGRLSQLLYRSEAGSRIKKIIPATGTHNPMSLYEKKAMFGEIPDNLFSVHDWKKNLGHAGTVPEDFIREKTGISGYSIPVWLNNNVLSREYSTIVSIGQVVPHEVAGMANHNKNIIIGTGGSEIINLSHYLSAVFGMEKIMGQCENPVRSIFDYAENNFLQGRDIFYILTVCGSQSVRSSESSIRCSGGRGRQSRRGIKGIFAGYGKECYNRACAASEKENIFSLAKKPAKIVVSLDKNIKSMWIGNKGIYRSRLAAADGGELIIIAPWVETFGEDKTLDSIIRKYGYMGKEAVTEAVELNNDLKENLSAAAHLIHGSSEGRFKIRWCPGKIEKKDVLKAGYDYASPGNIPEKYNPANLEEGFNHIKGEEIYYISDPGQGLWRG